MNIDLTEPVEDQPTNILLTLKMVSKDLEQHSTYAIFAKYGISILNEKSKVQYTILRNDNLYDGSEQAEGYFKSMKCRGYCSKKWCYECGLLAKNEAFNKRNREYQELLAQIDCVIMLNANGKLMDSIHCKYNQVPNFSKWINLPFDELNAHIKKQESRPAKYCSDNLNNLLNYYKKEVLDSKYHQLVKTYSALGGLLEEVEEHGIESWMLDCTRYMVNKTMEEK
ncbi:hypothetical protein RclHR1_05060017 [Rhizophagus clarus]|uniref:Uncharacterized protein n=1 Tax=Rhizophagus clarus TaxID=94130 RepID=A0A2Z6RLS8_9GLOM|nr:hypothetical protein RclHR1_05060017 [Rhizophagus clarus]